jgi:ribosome modulation factor
MNDAYQDGYAAFGKAVSLDANPFRGDTEKEKLWDDGWEDAKMEAEVKRRSICSEEGPGEPAH